MTQAQPLIVTVAPNGARKSRSDHPAIPLSPLELADSAQQCLEAGAVMIHLHVRGEHNEHSLDVGRYREAISAIRARVGSGLIIQATSEAVGVYTPVQQMAMVRELKPEAVSLAVRELCPADEAVGEAARFFKWLRREKISPQYILYSVADVLHFQALRERGVIPGDCPSVLFVLGSYGGGSSSPDQLQPLLRAMDQSVVWSVCAFGAGEADCMACAAERGGHCRVGFENNMHMASGEVAPDNAALIVQLGNTVNRKFATVDEARELLGVLRTSD